MDRLDRRSFLIGAVVATTGISAPVAVQKLTESNSEQHTSADPPEKDSESDVECDYWEGTENLNAGVVANQKCHDNPVIDGTEYREDQSYPPSVIRVED
jgi:hypothetical protein